mmetsp:Transcript_2365/g.2785  ORF Transcript_2365/g.2785 Transcript_2365/m.2785 type:complete len:164 (+) Transcript_2365:154-645(+)
MPHFALPKKNSQFLPKVGERQIKHNRLSPLRETHTINTKQSIYSSPRINRRCSLEASLNPESIKYFKEAYPINVKKRGDQNNWHKARISSKFRPKDKSLNTNQDRSNWCKSIKIKYKFIEKLLDKKKSPVKGNGNGKKIQDNQLLLEKIIFDRNRRSFEEPKF